MIRVDVSVPGYLRVVDHLFSSTGHKNVAPFTQTANARKQAFIDFIAKKVATYKDKEWMSVTFTLKQSIPRLDKTPQHLSRSEVQKCISHFLKELNKYVYGAAYRRYGKRLFVVPSVELSNNDRLHVHLLLETPAKFTHCVSNFYEKVSEIWSKLRWAMPERAICAIPPDKVGTWVSYVLKDVAKDDEVVDLQNLYLGEDKYVT